MKRWQGRGKVQPTWLICRSIRPPFRSRIQCLFQFFVPSTFFHLCVSVPVPGQVLEDPASVRRVRHSCSTKILLSDSTVGSRNGTKSNLTRHSKLIHGTIYEVYEVYSLEMSQRLVQGVPCPYPETAGTGSSKKPRDPIKSDKAVTDNGWMDEVYNFIVFVIFWRTRGCNIFIPTHPRLDSFQHRCLSDYCSCLLNTEATSQNKCIKWFVLLISVSSYSYHMCAIFYSVLWIQMFCFCDTAQTEAEPRRCQRGGHSTHWFWWWQL